MKKKLSPASYMRLSAYLYINITMLCGVFTAVLGLVPHARYKQILRVVSSNRSSNFVVPSSKVVIFILQILWLRETLTRAGLGQSGEKQDDRE
ncbi:hypothetical protein F5Y17DRAFT_415186 [Xylariaceae sp. FL0594]|nr:hypothetical protein F5Y17DRAFT_415186 [Xylariaceae sp. FL0594]